jgi:SOS-response transcriptional repressor LexA
VVAWYEGETTLKKLRVVKGGGVLLLPRNQNYQEIYIPEDRLDDLHIQGVVVMCWKRFAPAGGPTTFS